MRGIFGHRRSYFDYAGATPTLPQATRAFLRAQKLVGNPGALHREGVEARRALESAREDVARFLSCRPREVIFTSGSTESNNLAILGFAEHLDRAGAFAGTHWVTSSIEHSSVSRCFEEIERLGGKVSRLSPKENGVIDVSVLIRALCKETVFVSIGWGNGEIGAMQPLSEMARALRAHESIHRTKVLFHSDAGQAPLYESPAVHTLGVDLLSLGAEKLYAPFGVGALYLGGRAELSPVMLGGGQERGLRAGTEKAALAAGFGCALTILGKERATERARLKHLRDLLSKELSAQVPDLVVNGDPRRALPHILNVSIPGIQSEYMALLLDRRGVALSTKSACDEGRQSLSHVVKALGGEEWRARCALRFSLGRSSGRSDVLRAARILGRLRARFFPS